MKYDIKQKWVAALRSGNYTQGKSCLHDIEGNFCCLGVLCDLYIKENPHSDANWVKSGNTFTFMDDVSHADFVLPMTVIGWAALSSSIPFVKGKGFLDEINDQGIPFSEIADLIEKDRGL